MSCESVRRLSGTGHTVGAYVPSSEQWSVSGKLSEFKSHPEQDFRGYMKRLLARMRLVQFYWERIPIEDHLTFTLARWTSHGLER